MKYQEINDKIEQLYELLKKLDNSKPVKLKHLDIGVVEEILVELSYVIGRSEDIHYLAKDIEEGLKDYKKDNRLKYADGRNSWEDEEVEDDLPDNPYDLLGDISDNDLDKLKNAIKVIDITEEV